LRDVWFFRACGIRHVIGAPIAGDLRRLRTDPVTGDTEREAERLARCLESLGPIDPDNPEQWDLQLKPKEQSVADAALVPLQGRDFVAVSLGGKDRAKDWGNDKWSALLRMMAIRYADLGLVFIGSGDEFDRCSEIAAGWRGPALNLCGRLLPRESAAAMRRALFYLGHDCGPMHLAAAAGTRCVAVFGPVNMPKWWHPMGAKHRIIHNMCSIRDITPEEVLAAIGAVAADLPNRTPDRGVSMTA
jgi:ADP-heptose:LPS heptosyltransferase